MTEPARPMPGRRRKPSPGGSGTLPERLRERREARQAARNEVYRRRRIMAIGLLLLGFVALVFAVFTQTSGATESGVPIDPNNADPATVIAEAGEVSISTPIRPASITGIGYHPDGESLIEMDPRGKNLSTNAIFRLFLGDSTPENIQYYVMDPADRSGFRTGAVDVGAEAGAAVYSPVTGVVTAIRPDPMVQGANVVEIKPSDDPDVRVYVTLVRDISEGIGPDKPVTAGMTELGAVADSAAVLKPQLAEVTDDAGNHVTVSAMRVS